MKIQATDGSVLLSPDIRFPAIQWAMRPGNRIDSAVQFLDSVQGAASAEPEAAAAATAAALRCLHFSILGRLSRRFSNHFVYGESAVHPHSLRSKFSHNLLPL